MDTACEWRDSFPPDDSRQHQAGGSQSNSWPPFDEALELFRKFLRNQGVSDSIRWIWRDAIISSRRPGSHRTANRRIFIDGNRSADESLIREYYQLGVERGLGIALRVFCRAGQSAVCYIEIPEDETAAEYLMMGPLKCTVPDPCPEAFLIRSLWMAAVLRFFIRTPANASVLNDVPPRPGIFKDVTDRGCR